MNELLLAEFVAEQPLLLPAALRSPPQLAHDPQPPIAPPGQADGDGDE